MKEKFKFVVMQAVEKIIKEVEGEGKNILFLTIKPIINIAKPALEQEIEKNPEDIYMWLKLAENEIKACIKAYDEQNNKM